ncbi:MAG: hypothetical protein HOO92_02055 [Methylococcaceae bacterium]|nr:hypothetical protein [Methylococcaceae bacterium]
METSQASHYDCILIGLTEAGLILDCLGNQLVLPTFTDGNDWALQYIGKIGIASYDPEFECWRFVPYLDQSLRRVFELDDEYEIGWSNETKGNNWTAPIGIIPGENGAFIKDDTDDVWIPVPPEFFIMCEQYNQTPESVLRSFIADVCEIKNYDREPRADGYCSNGSDERRLADEYFSRAFWNVE